MDFLTAKRYLRPPTAVKAKEKQKKSKSGADQVFPPHLHPLPPGERKRKVEGRRNLQSYQGIRELSII